MPSQSTTTEQTLWRRIAGRFLVATSIALATAFCAPNNFAGEYNSVLSTGDSMPAWTELPGTDGELHSSSTLNDQDVVVVVFTCNSCPYAIDLDDRLVALSKRYEKKSFALVAINVNLIDEDRMPAMKEKAEQKKFTFPYLFDQSQGIAKSFGAKYTPECFVFDDERKLVYQGSMDDSPDGTSVSKRYVIDAIEAAFRDSLPATKESVPIGCRIRFKRERRTPRK